MQCVNMLPIVYCWNKSSRMLLRHYWVYNAVKGRIHEQLTTFFSITKQMFAAFYFSRSRSRVDKQSLRGNNFWMTEKWWVVWQPIRREKKIWAKLWCGVVYNKFISLFGWTTKMLLKWIQDSRSKCVFGIAVAVVVVVWKKLFYKKYF